MKQRIEPAAERPYDLRYVSRLTPEEIRARLEEQTKPYRPQITHKAPLLLFPWENGDRYLISTGYHRYPLAFGIALLHLEPRPGAGDTVIYGAWKKKVPVKRRVWDFVIPILCLAALIVLHQVWDVNPFETIRNWLIATAAGIIISVIIRFTSPKYRVEERQKLRDFIETNLLD